MSRSRRWLIAGCLAITSMLIGTLAVPLRTWRTGDQGLVPLSHDRLAPIPASPRVWIDTDAACGHDPRTDPDDCLAIWMLARARGVTIAGVSTVFGNASRDIVDRTMVELAGLVERDTGRTLRTWPGAADAIDDDGSDASAFTNLAARGLVEALEDGPLTIVALGPLTNVARLLDHRPDLAGRIQALVAVMGRRPGHLFHPAEGAAAGSFLGHGPVFRDFNFTMDVRAVRTVIGTDVPLVLVPYDAARGVELTAGDVERLERAGNTGRWIAPRLRPWLRHWRESIGRDGFFPFDLLAAGLVSAPDRFRCALVQARVARDDHLLLPGLRPLALLVDDRPPADPQLRSSRTNPAWYCGEPPPDIARRLVVALTAG